MSRVILASSRGQASVARAKSELRRNAGVRRGPRRKIVPIASAERRIANDDESESLEDDLDDDAPLEYDAAFAPDAGGARTDDDVASTRARRGTSASTRAREDPTHAAFIAPRVAIGVVGDLASRASRGPADGFKDVFEFAESLRTSTDVLGDVMRRAEREIDRLEAIGVRATAEAREAARGAVPEEVYEAYVMPAVEYAEDEENGVDGTSGGSSASVTVGGDEAFDEAAVHAAADAVAAAMAGGDVTGEGSSSSSSSSSTMDSDNFEDTVEEMAANAIMSSSTMSASYSTPETPYGARAPPVPKNGDVTTTAAETPETVPETPPPAVETEPKAPEPAPVASTAAFDATVGYWRKIDAECPNEEPLMDIMDMNVVFRQAAGLLNYLRVERPTPDSWGVASSAGIIQIAETYPIDGTPTATPRRDLRAGDQTGVVSALDDDVVRLVISWSDDLPGSQTETFRVDDAGALVREVNITLQNGDSWSGVYRYRRA